MKTLYLTDSSTNIVVDKDTDFVGTLRSEDRYNIRNVYYIEEPVHVVYQSGEIKEEIDAKKGEILILFYNDRFNKYHLDTIRTKRWAANIKNRLEIEQKEKEEWAAKNAEANVSAPCCDCECACNCADPFESEPVAEAPKKEGVGKKLKNMLKKVTKKA